MLKCKFCLKLCKNDNSLRNHERLCKSNENRQIPNFMNFNKQKLDNCKFCSKELLKNNLVKHENSCAMNPQNIKECPVCFTPFHGNKTTCSYSCANTYFRSGKNNGNWKEEAYRSTCFLYHKKECVICGELKIVSVHHMNEDRNDNRPENLIPLCPTHHQYFHSVYRNEVEPKILEYIKNFNRPFA